MARYIDADELFNVIGRAANSILCEPYKEGEARGLLMAMKTIKKFPTADVAPRAEVAREIFWEMDKLLLSITIDEEAEESFVGFDFDKYIALKKTYTQSEPPEAKQPKDPENFEKKRLIHGDCFHGEIWYMCPYCFTGIEARSIPENRICRKCGLEYIYKR